MSIAEWIHPHNAVKAAQFILNLDQSMIQEHSRPDMASAIYWLKDSLDHYLHPHPEQRFNGLSQADNLDYAIKSLLEAIRTVLPRLTEEAQMQLRQFLLVSSLPRAVA